MEAFLRTHEDEVSVDQWKVGHGVQILCLETAGRWDEPGRCRVRVYVCLPSVRVFPARGDDSE